MNRYIALTRIVELGSFTKAAEELGYTQPALSQMIASLENDLSIKLLNRSRFGISLTPDGERLYPSIVDTVCRYSSLQEIASEIRGLEEGTVHIGTISSISCHWLPELIQSFKELYPGVKFILHQGDWKIISEWVASRHVDFGFINPDAINDNMKTYFLKDDPLMAVVSKDSPLAKKDYVTLKELSQEPFLLLEEGSLNEPLEAFKKAKLEPNISIVAHDDYSIMMMIEKGLGVSILPKLVLHRTNYDIVIKEIKPTIKRSLGIVSPDFNLLPIASQKFIKFILDNTDKLQ